MPINDTDQKLLHKAMPVLWFLWGAMFASLFVYGGLVGFFGDNIRNPEPLLDAETMQTLTLTLAGIGVCLLIAAFFVRRLTLSNAISTSANTNLAGAGSGTEPPLPAIAKFTTGMLISLALCEAVAIFGLTLFLLGTSSSLFYGFAGAGAFAMLFFRPSRAAVEQMLPRPSESRAIIKT